MTRDAWMMLAAGVAALVAGLLLVRARFSTAMGVRKVLVLGPVFEAVALAIFAAEHFLDARDLASIVPRWLPGALFWTYFFGVALLAAVISLILWRAVPWSAALLALFFLLIVVTVDLPGVSRHSHERLFWILIVRETAFAGGAMALAGNVWPGRGRAGSGLMAAGRLLVTGTLMFYGVEHFLFPRNVPGVPLEKMTPAWVPAPMVLAYLVGVTLLVAGAGLLVPRWQQVAAAGAGAVLLLLTLFFYVPILATEIRSPLAVEGVNYVGDTLLFASTVLLAGTGTRAIRDRSSLIRG